MPSDVPTSSYDSGATPLDDAAPREALIASRRMWKRRAERAETVIEAGKALINHWSGQGYRPDSPWASSEAHAFVAAMDAYEKAGA